MWVGVIAPTLLLFTRVAAEAAVPRLAPGSARPLAAGVSPARLKNNRHVDSKGLAAETANAASFLLLEPNPGSAGVPPA